MKRIMLIIFTMILLLQISAEKIDINNTSLSALDTLMIPDDVINGIKEYIEEYGEIQSVYELKNIEGIDDETFEILKLKLAIYPDTAVDRTSIYIIRLQDRLASEESPTQGAIDIWENMLTHRMNINSVTMNELLQIQGVNITDAVAIMKTRNSLGDFTYDTQIRRSPGLTYYAWSQLRNYITYEEPSSDWEFSGYVRSNMNFTNDDTYNYTSYTGLKYLLSAAAYQLSVSAPDSTNIRDLLLDAGVSSEDVETMREDMLSQYEQLDNYEMDGDFSNKFRLNFGKYINAGGVIDKNAGIEELQYKGYVNFTNLGFIDNIYLGNYRVSIGQGLVMDNTDEYRARRFDIIKGLFPDVTSTEGNKLTGMAIDGNIDRFNYLFFGSQEKRNAVLNSDGTVNMLILNNTIFSEFKDKLEERMFGGRFAFDLGGLGFLPLSTQIGVSGFRSAYSRTFMIDTLMIDIPFDKDNISTPVYTQSFTGNTRDVIGIDFRTDFKNISFEGEASKQDDAYAYVVRSDLIFANFYLKTIFRHYDAGYDNPYARPLSEQSRFDDTTFEKEYRLLNPLFSMIVDDPRPKPEEGIYFETRFRITDKFTITKAYLDLWKTLDYNMHNYRFQGELEYRPVFPIRIRLKQKIQEKNLYKVVHSTTSFTSETTLRVFAILSNNDYINFEARYGKVDLTTNQGLADDYVIDGTYVNASFEHRITDYFSVLGGFATWKTNGMSQWIFEDTGIDFLYGDGQKYYITMIDRISENVSMRAKASMNYQDIPFFGIYNPNSTFRYANGDFIYIRDFAEYSQLFNLSVQLAIRW